MVDYQERSEEGDVDETGDDGDRIGRETNGVASHWKGIETLFPAE